MKAFVIKNKVHGYFGVNNMYQYPEWSSIDLAYYFKTEEEAEKFKNKNYPTCEVVEITIAEGDLEEKNRVLKRAFDKMLADLMNYVREYQENSTNEYAIACCKDILSQMWHTRHNQDLFIEQAKGEKER